MCCNFAGKNVLISCKEACKCADILHCKCPEDSEKKYGVFLADFDHMICPADCNDVQKVGGTYTYRPPEVGESRSDQTFCSTVEPLNVDTLKSGHLSNQDTFLGPKSVRIWGFHCNV